jgi:ABC-type transport system substrate-binding protein
MKKLNFSFKLATISLVIIISLSVLGNISVTNTKAEVNLWGFWQEISINCNHPILKDKRVRLGLSHLVDRESVMDIWLDYNGPLVEGEELYPGVTTWVPTVPWCNPQLEPNNNVEKGLELLEEAGYGIDSDNKLELTLLTPNTNPARIAWSLAIAERWNSFGHSITVVTMGWGEIMPRMWYHPAQWDEDPTTKIPSFEEGGYDLFSIGLSFGILDEFFDPIIDSNWDETYTSGHPDNVYQYSNVVFDSLINNWIQAGKGNRGLAYAIQKALFNDPPVIVLFVYVDP